MANLAACLSSQSNEHYTPVAIIQEVTKFFGGGIELDPASCEVANKNVRAHQFFSQEDDGLAKQWEAKTLFLNPPYKNVSDWTKKLINQFELGNFCEGIYLVPSRTDTAWFNTLNHLPVCFIRGRLRFEPNKSSAPFPSCLFYLGARNLEFAQHFSTLGAVRPAVLRGEA